MRGQREFSACSSPKLEFLKFFSFCLFLFIFPVSIPTSMAGKPGKAPDFLRTPSSQGYYGTPLYISKVKWSILRTSLETHNGDPDSIVALIELRNAWAFRKTWTWESNRWLQISAIDGGHKLDKPQNSPQSTHTTLSSSKFTTPGTYLPPLRHLASINVFTPSQNPPRSPYTSESSLQALYSTSLPQDEAPTFYPPPDTAA